MSLTNDFLILLKAVLIDFFVRLGEAQWANIFTNSLSLHTNRGIEQH